MISLPKCIQCKKLLKNLMIIFRGQSNYNLELNEWEPVRLKSTINKSFHKLMDEPYYSLGRAGEKYRDAV